MPKVKIFTNKDIIRTGTSGQTFPGFSVDKAVRGSRNLLRNYKVIYSEVFFLSEEASLFRRNILEARENLQDKLNNLVDLYKEKDRKVRMKRRSSEWEDSMNKTLERIKECEAQVEEYRNTVEQQKEIERMLNA